MGDLTMIRLGSLSGSAGALSGSAAGAGVADAVAATAKVGTGSAGALAWIGEAPRECIWGRSTRRIRTRLSPRCTSSSATPVSVTTLINSRISSRVILKEGLNPAYTSGSEAGRATAIIAETRQGAVRRRTSARLSVLPIPMRSSGSGSTCSGRRTLIWYRPM